MNENEEKVLNMIAEINPYTAEYLRKYGIHSGVVFNRNRTKTEKLYKECLEKGVRWQDILGEYDPKVFY